MQVTEVLLYSTLSSVYVSCNNYKINQQLVLSIGGSFELGLVKGDVEISNPELIDVVRVATREDNIVRCENCKLAKSYLPEIKKEVEKFGLDMKISAVAINLDKSKIIINYTADGRVDFRDLVKSLGAKYKSRIEMKQIGNRDESKMIGAIGICGQETCCKRFLADFAKVSIKMAKNQNIALNPNRINGMCGRLLCCLKYEDEFYEEMQKKMPRNGYKVTTPDGNGIVSSTDFLKETVTVSFTKDDATETKVYSLDDIKFNSRDKK